MKSLTLTLSLLFGLAANVFAQQSYNKESVSRALPVSSNYLEIPSSFSAGEIDKMDLSNALKGKKISKIELIYTQYKLNPSFDQVKLNNTRTTELNRSIPQTRNSDIVWTWVEQTGAKTTEDAKGYFHGFRIYLEEESSNPSFAEKEKNADFERIQFRDEANLPKVFVVNNSKGGTFTHESGSVLHVPAYAVLDEAGKPVTGNYNLSYTEYRDAAQMAFSGIPMTYSEQGTDFNFSSVGMYEVRGTQGDQELSLAKPITIDFNCTEVANDVDFYEMNDETGVWTKKEPIVFDAISTSSTQLETTVQGVVKSKDPSFKKAFTLESSSSSETPNEIKYTLSKELFDVYTKLKPKEKTFFSKTVLSENEPKMEVTVRTTAANAFLNVLYGIDQIDAGHTFPTLVSGLASKNFGVYNCDQVRRIGNPVIVQADFHDINDSILGDFKVACLIDKSLNASLSFPPKAFTANRNGNSILLLFDEYGQISAVTENEMKKIQRSETPDLKVEDLSGRVTNSSDLKAYLKL